MEKKIIVPVYPQIVEDLQKELYMQVLEDCIRIGDVLEEQEDCAILEIFVTSDLALYQVGKIVGKLTERYLRENIN